MTVNELYKQLIKPFPVKSLSWRSGGGGRNYVYIDARDVLQRLDEVCGWGGWQTSYSEAGGIVTCSIGILHPEKDLWIWKSDGAGETQVESEKGAMSSALKRAAVHHGIGRYLYWMKLYPELSARKQVPDWMHPEHERWQ